ncbi:MAG: hypothetical protein LBF22_04940, partial [Deltaproteobacteria bacterium]|nr:hypothetical protein [Deltaproteobacteria bacterium]
MHFDKVIAKYRNESRSLREQGDRFEKLIANFLRTYQVYDAKFKHIWQWQDFPFKEDVSLRDMGIDLVAETREGEFWAIQAKCYKEDAYIPKSS